MRVMIAGSSGLVGTAAAKKFESEGHEVIGINSKQLNLLERKKTIDYLIHVKPDVIVDAAARVGGIGANYNFPVDFLSNNLQIQCNLVDGAILAGVSKFIFLGSSCIYPRNCAQPIKEDYLMSGTLEPTNSAYAVAKIAGLEAIKSVRKQYSLNWISLMPTNVYGPHDNFNLEQGHVLPALIRKFVEASEKDSKKVKLWGDGNSLREFIYSDDLANAIYLAYEKYDEDQHLNVGTGREVSIRELAQIISKVVNFSGEIEWDTSKPNGTPRKVLDSHRIYNLGFKPMISLEQGIENTVMWFLHARKNRQVRL